MGTKISHPKSNIIIQTNNIKYKISLSPYHKLQPHWLPEGCLTPSDQMKRENEQHQPWPRRQGIIVL